MRRNEVPFVDTEHGLINIDSIFRIQSGGRIWYREEGKIISTRSVYQDSRTILRMSAPMVPALPGYYVIKIPDNGGLWLRPIIAWAIFEWGPYPIFIGGKDEDCDILTPEGKVITANCQYNNISAYWTACDKEKVMLPRTNE
jgi:hypothetical protein